MSSFQGAHKVANDLAEVVVQTVEDTLNATGNLVMSPPQFKSYRVLELGSVTTNATSSAGLDITFGTASGGAQLVGSAAIPVVPIAAGLGVTYSTKSTFDFNAAGTGSVDSGGVPRLEKGESIWFNVTGAADAATKAIAFARLAPIIEYTD